jgi:AcrR family transcriptional regulator
MPSNIRRAALKAFSADPSSGAAGDPATTLPALLGRRVESPSIRRILLAAVDAFWKDGFHAASTRDIAKKARLSPAAVYVHFKSKEELLFTIIVVIAEQLEEQLVIAARASGTPGERLKRLVQVYVTFPARVYKAAHVANSEFESLGAAQRKPIVRIRERIEALLQECLEAGCAAGEFRIARIAVVKMAIVSLCQSALRWYSPRGDLAPEEIGDMYADLALAMVTAARVTERGAGRGCDSSGSVD